MNAHTVGGGVDFLHPVQVNERVPALDILRGVALFGILIVNINHYGPVASSTTDTVTVGFIDVFMVGSFYPMFSMLFGVGFAVFLERGAARGAHVLAPYLRRIAMLFVIAALMGVLVEDRLPILLQYAFWALPLLLFWRASARLCIAAALMCLSLSILRAPIDRAVAIVEQQMSGSVAGSSLGSQRAAERKIAEARQAARQRAEESHSFFNYAAFRAQSGVPAQIASLIELRSGVGLNILAMFLVGVAGWRSGIFSGPTVPRVRLKHIALWCGVAGVAGNLYRVVMSGPEGAVPDLLARWPTPDRALMLTSDIVLTFAYVAAVLLLVPRERSEGRLTVAPLASVGRMGLTNYLSQLVVMSLLFLPYGLGLQLALPRWSYALIGVVIYVSHFPISAFWMARFRFGPVEWLWRSATYGRWQVM